MTRPVVLLCLVASLMLAAQTNASDEISEIDVCRDFSLIANSVMIARQRKSPMSETLPFAIGQIELWGQKYELEMDPEDVEELAAELTIHAYDTFAWPVGSTYDDKRQDAISEFEDKYFESCYTELTSE